MSRLCKECKEGSAIPKSAPFLMPKFFWLQCSACAYQTSPYIDDRLAHAEWLVESDPDFKHQCTPYAIAHASQLEPWVLIGAAGVVDWSKGCHPQEFITILRQHHLSMTIIERSIEFSTGRTLVNDLAAMATDRCAFLVPPMGDLGAHAYAVLDGELYDPAGRMSNQHKKMLLTKAYLLILIDDIKP